MNISLGCNALLNISMVNGEYIVKEQLATNTIVQVNTSPLKTVNELLDFLFGYSLATYEELSITQMKDVIEETAQTLIESKENSL